MTDNTAPKLSSLIPVSIEGEMKKSYLEYAMSVIVSRALPDCRDGLKPVQRRILYAMHELNNYHDRPYKKSAKVVGEVIGNYHPHGNDPIYMALVRMAQEFSLREPLIDGQGNFGSLDGDSPAAMRYTEVRLAKLSAKILEDIGQGTVDFQDNYDGSTKEPKVLPSQFPNLLVNGATGIAVGMATSIPTHNLGEVIDACCAYIRNNEITIDELLQIVPGPDFPTGALILGYDRARNALLTGRGSVAVRARADIEELGGRNAIIVKEIPYQVNKAELLKTIEGLVKLKTIDGIYEIRDETNKLGVRIVIELKKEAVPDVVLNQLFKYTSLQTSISVNMLALNRGMPIMMNLRDFIVAFVDFREEVVTRRIFFQLTKARDRAHSLIGLSLAVSNIDEIIHLIKSSNDPATAKRRLMEKDWEAATVIPLLKLVDDYRNELVGSKCKFTDEQASAILDMKLQRLTALEKGKIESELEVLASEIKDFLDILSSKERLFNIIYDELTSIKDKYATPRRSEIIIAEDDVNIESLIQREEMVVTTTMGGYIKRVPLITYKAQRRGGKGRSAMSIYEDDMTTDIISTSTHTPLLFFSDKGKVYRMKVYKLPLGSPQSKGRAIINLLPLTNGEKISNITALPEDPATWENYSIIFATAKGSIRRNDLTAFSNIQSNGKIAIKLDEGDKLIGVAVCSANQHVMLCTKSGKALRFPVSKLRIFKSRASDGVKGIRLGQVNDAVVSMTILSESAISMEKREELLSLPLDLRTDIASKELIDNTILGAKELQYLALDEVHNLSKAEQFILTITEKGYGKRTSAYEYRITGRGGQGVLNIDTSERNGSVVASFPINHADEIILITNAGTLIRTKAKDIRITGRNAMGVRIINLKENEKVISVSRIIGSDAIIEEIDEELELMEENAIDEKEAIIDRNI